MRIAAIGSSALAPADRHEAYVRSDASTAAMAVEAARAALFKADCRPDQIDAVVLVTESFWDGFGALPHLDMRDQLLCGLVAEVGLVRAAIYGSWTSACGNLAPALDVSRALLASQSTERVLLIAADRVRPGVRRRLASGAAVLSDVAAAAVLDREAGGLQLRQVLLQPAAEVLVPRVERNFVLQTRELRRALNGLCEKVQTCAGRRLGDFDLVVAETLEEPLVAFLCAQAGVDRSRLVTPGRGTHGHAFSADLLLSLGAVTDLTRREAPLSIAAVSISSWTLSAACFELVGTSVEAPARRPADEHADVA